MKLSPALLEEVKRHYAEAKKQAEAYEAVLRANGALPVNGNGHAQVQPQALYRQQPTFPGRILKLMADHPDGLSRREIIYQLEQAGVTVSGKSDLSHRVSVELHQLKSKKKLKQVEDKYFFSQKT